MCGQLFSHMAHAGLMSPCVRVIMLGQSYYDGTQLQYSRVDRSYLSSCMQISLRMEGLYDYLLLMVLSRQQAMNPLQT